MKTYEICGIVDVNMYNTILMPDFVLEQEYKSEEEEQRLWDRFNLTAYVAIIRKRAVIELKKLLENLPKELQCRYVEDSAEIVMPHEYNYGGDFLRFKMTAECELSQPQMQTYLSTEFESDWDAEFGSAYRIMEYITENYTLEEFCMESNLSDHFPYILQFHYVSTDSDPDTLIWIAFANPLSADQVSELEDSITSYLDSVPAWEMGELIKDVLSEAGYEFTILHPNLTIYL